MKGGWAGRVSLKWIILPLTREDCGKNLSLASIILPLVNKPIHTQIIIHIIPWKKLLNENICTFVRIFHYGIGNQKVTKNCTWYGFLSEIYSFFPPKAIYSIGYSSQSFGICTVGLNLWSSALRLFIRIFIVITLVKFPFLSHSLAACS